MRAGQAMPHAFPSSSAPFLCLLILHHPVLLPLPASPSATPRIIGRCRVIIHTSHLSTITYLCESRPRLLPNVPCRSSALGTIVDGIISDGNVTFPLHPCAGKTETKNLGKNLEMEFGRRFVGSGAV
jgi:hypothetical protein